MIALAAAPLAPCAAQEGGSLAVGVGTVRYAGGTAFSSASFTPAFVHTARSCTANGTGALASLPNGVWSIQGRGDAWCASPVVVARVRLGVETIVAGTKRTDGGWSGAAHGIGELLWAEPKWGIGVGGGPSGGWIASEPSIGAAHFRARAWWQSGKENWSVSLEPTHFPDGWFTDIGVGVAVERSRFTATLWAAGRVSSVYTSSAAASAALQVRLSRFVALEVSGGSYLAEPYQGLPRAGYFTAGVRLRVPNAVVGPSSPLLPTRVGDSLVVRFRLGGASSVAIAGDWNAWNPAPLRRLGPDRWEAVLALRAGVYHFNLLVDGTDWVVPHGVATVDDGLGALVGVLIVQ